MYNTEKFLLNIPDAKEQEYIMLREAVWKHMEAQRKISVFVITSSLAFYTIVFSINITEPYVFLLPMIILLPYAYKTLDHKISISYLVGYQIVCLENNRNIPNAFAWETDFFLLRRKGYDKYNGIIYNKLCDCEFLFMGSIAFVMYEIYFIKHLYI